MLPTGDKLLLPIKFSESPLIECGSLGYINDHSIGLIDYLEHSIQLAIRRHEQWLMNPSISLIK